MDTGQTTLASASEAMAAGNGLAIRFNLPRDAAAGSELCLVTDDPAGAFREALEAGAAAVRPAEEKPWGQTAACVRDLDGCAIELCTPVVYR